MRRQVLADQRIEIVEPTVTRRLPGAVRQADAPEEHHLERFHTRGLFGQLAEVHLVRRRNPITHALLPATVRHTEANSISASGTRNNFSNTTYATM